MDKEVYDRKDKQRKEIPSSPQKLSYSLKEKK